MIQELPKQEWKPYFDYISHYIPRQNMPTKLVKIEVESLDLGYQELTEGILEGISYDPREDTLFIFTENMEHLVPLPQEIYIDRDIKGVNSIEIIDHEDYAHLVIMRDPLRLPEARRA